MKTHRAHARVFTGLYPQFGVPAAPVQAAAACDQAAAKEVAHAAAVAQLVAVHKAALSESRAAADALQAEVGDWPPQSRTCIIF